jgi:uncharacterized protein YaiL (DUF2058 family)
MSSHKTKEAFKRKEGFFHSLADPFFECYSDYENVLLAKKGESEMSFEKELLKAGLINKKKAREIQHQKRVDQKTGKAEQSAQEREQIRLQQKAEEKQREEEQRSKAEEKTRKERIRHLALANKVASFGNIRYYFVARNQRILYLEIFPEMVQNLSQGKHAIVEVLDSSPKNMSSFPKLSQKKYETLIPP